MSCPRCLIHYCFRCGVRLDPKNPYQHFSHRGEACSFTLVYFACSDTITRCSVSINRFSSRALSCITLQERHVTISCLTLMRMASLSMRGGTEWAKMRMRTGGGWKHDMTRSFICYNEEVQVSVLLFPSVST